MGIARDAGIGGLGSVKKSGALGPVWPLAPFPMGGLQSVVASLLLLMMLVAGCGDGTVDNHVPPSIPERSDKHLASRAPTSPVTTFPRHDAPLGTDRGGEYFAAQLVLQEGCLRAEVASKYDPNDPGSWLLIWPDGFAFETEAETVRVVNELGRVVAHVGGHIRLSPAAATFQQATEQGLIEGLSDDCAGPYFLVGDEVSAFDLGSEATELRLSDPDVVFFRERTVIARHQTLMNAAGVGELILDGPCLRLKDSSPREHWPTIIWPAGFTPHVNDGVVEIRNGAGRVMAQVGNQIAGGGGYFRAHQRRLFRARLASQHNENPAGRGGLLSEAGWNPDGGGGDGAFLRKADPVGEMPAGGRRRHSGERPGVRRNIPADHLAA